MAACGVLDLHPSSISASRRISLDFNFLHTPNVLKFFYLFCAFWPFSSIIYHPIGEDLFKMLLIIQRTSADLQAAD